MGESQETHLFVLCRFAIALTSSIGKIMLSPLNIILNSQQGDHCLHMNIEARMKSESGMHAWPLSDTLICYRWFLHLGVLSTPWWSGFSQDHPELIRLCLIHSPFTSIWALMVAIDDCHQGILFVPQNPMLYLLNTFSLPKSFISDCQLMIIDSNSTYLPPSPLTLYPGSQQSSLQSKSSETTHKTPSTA